MCIGIIGAVVSGIGAYMGVKTQQANYEAQQKVHQRQANLERVKGSYEAARMTERGRQLLGKQVAAYGASGVALKGTIGEAHRKTGEELALDVAARRYGTKINVENETILSRIQGMNAASASKAAPIAFLSPVIQGVGTFLSNGFR